MANQPHHSYPNRCHHWCPIYHCQVFPSNLSCCQYLSTWYCLLFYSTYPLQSHSDQTIPVLRSYWKFWGTELPHFGPKVWPTWFLFQLLNWPYEISFLFPIHRVPPKFREPGILREFPGNSPMFPGSVCSLGTCFFERIPKNSLGIPLCSPGTYVELYLEFPNRTGI